MVPSILAQRATQSVRHNLRRVLRGSRCVWSIGSRPQGARWIWRRRQDILLGCLPTDIFLWIFGQSKLDWDAKHHQGKKDPTPFLIPISRARAREVAFDFGAGKFTYKDDPDPVHSAKSGAQSSGSNGPKSYWLLPLTSKAANNHTPAHRSTLSPTDSHIFDPACRKAIGSGTQPFHA